jgi:hypothetical protein
LLKFHKVPATRPTRTQRGGLLPGVRRTYQPIDGISSF